MATSSVVVSHRLPSVFSVSRCVSESLCPFFSSYPSIYLGVRLVAVFCLRSVAVCVHVCVRFRVMSVVRVRPPLSVSSQCCRCCRCPRCCLSRVSACLQSVLCAALCALCSSKELKSALSTTTGVQIVQPLSLGNVKCSDHARVQLTSGKQSLDEDSGDCHCE